MFYAPLSFASSFLFGAVAFSSSELSPSSPSADDLGDPAAFLCLLAAWRRWVLFYDAESSASSSSASSSDSDSSSGTADRLGSLVLMLVLPLSAVRAGEARLSAALAEDLRLPTFDRGLDYLRA